MEVVGTASAGLNSVVDSTAAAESSRFVKYGTAVESLFTELGHSHVAGDVGASGASSGQGGARSKSTQLAAVTEARSWGLSPDLVTQVQRAGLKSFFPIQRQVVPVLVQAFAGLDATLGDICVSAPTGSGKTLVYVLPILDALIREHKAAGSLSAKGIHRLRALVVLPTRDLAQQVHAIFQRYTLDTGVVVRLAVGQTAFSEEQSAIIGACDVIVCTPGRLTDHLDASPALKAALAGLRYLVVDEADRLLAESYQDWVHRINDAVFVAAVPEGGQTYTSGIGQSNQDAVLSSFDASSSVIQPATSRLWRGDGSRVGAVLAPEPAHDATALGSAAASTTFALPPWAAAGHRASAASSSASLRPTPMPVPFRRIVCSATLTSNPQKLAGLGLRQATYYVSREDVAAGAGAQQVESGVEEGTVSNDDGKKLYTLPSTLHQVYSICGAAEKPIALLHILRLLEGQHLTDAAGSAPGAAADGLRALVFAGSVETTHRLCRVLQLYGGLKGRVVEFSANMSQAKRSAILEAAKAGVISVIVSSDAAARGLDLPSLPAVIHYDVAPRVKTYVHRVGRAARAGRVGVTYSLVRPDQMRHFKQLMGRTIAGHTATKETLTASLVSDYAPRLQQVLVRLRRVLEAERAGSLADSAPVHALSDADIAADAKASGTAATVAVEAP